MANLPVRGYGECGIVRKESLWVCGDTTIQSEMVNWTSDVRAGACSILSIQTARVSITMFSVLLFESALDFPSHSIEWCSSFPHLFPSQQKGLG